MIPKRIKIEVIIETDRATKECTEEEVKEWHTQQLQKTFDKHFIRTNKSDRVESCTVTFLE